MNHPFQKSDWDSIRAFLAVARAGSFNRAAQEVGVTVATLRRTVERLEDVTGFPLFTRDKGEGARLTAEGRRMIAAAEQVEKTVTDLWRIASAAADTLKGPIRLAITEGLGAYWVMPQLTRYLREQEGDVRVELQCAMRSVDVQRFEADIAIQFQEPTNPDLIVRRLAYLYLVPFASEAYVRERGQCRSFPDLANHLMVEQETDQLSDYGLDSLFGPGSTARMVRFKSNFSSAHYWAVANGAGIGLLPSYARLIGGSVVPMEMGWSMKVPIYMTTHPDLLRSARHREFADWLADCFSPKRFPWFGDEYLPPAQIERLAGRLDMEDYFAGFAPVRPSALPLAAAG